MKLAWIKAIQPSRKAIYRGSSTHLKHTQKQVRSIIEIGRKEEWSCWRRKEEDGNIKIEFLGISLSHMWIFWVEYGAKISELTTGLKFWRWGPKICTWGGKILDLSCIRESWHLETLVGIFYKKEGLTWWLEEVFVWVKRVLDCLILIWIY